MDDLLTIGTFAKAARLSPKALRIYDELGLLLPARVDPVTGYRFYTPRQLEQARLVAWLRRLDMPLARIREVCTLDAPAAAREVRAFWAQVEADTAARRDLAAFLVDHLSGPDQSQDPGAPQNGTRLRIRCAVLTDTGQVRAGNQDAAYAGARLLAVADGFGPGGDLASAAAIDALKPLETELIPAGSLLNALEDAVSRAGRAVQDLADDEAGTTLTAMLWTGSQLALVHIGDSRAYLLRDGGLFQITHDHTMVQSMVEQGRISQAEADSHPQRSLLLRALSGDRAATSDLRLHEVRAGDRYLLCSDGLSAEVPLPELRRVLTTVADPEEVVRELIAAANRAGGTDNASCVVADVLPHQE
jgi:serine/threonine protein phosphatase PrpC/DNA-binding transcriptional MerR regulator